MQNAKAAYLKTILLLLLAPTIANSQEAQQQVLNFPEGQVQSYMYNTISNFNILWGDRFVISTIQNLGLVKDIEQVLDMQFETAILPVSDSRSGKLNIQAMSFVEFRNDSLETIRRQFMQGIEEGDYLIGVDIRDHETDITYTSINSMSQDGEHFSGFLFNAFRVPTEESTRKSRPNTVCDKKTLTRTLWGSEAETVRTCVRAFCENGQCTACKTLEVESHASPLARIETLPSPEVVPADGEITGNCCFGGTAWAWVSGFKRIAVGLGGASLEIEGQLGQGANGFFTVEECC